MATERDARIAAFLSNYVTPTNRLSAKLPATPEYIMSGIRVLIEDGYMTADEIRLKALADYDVFIPDDYFPEV